MGYVCAHAAGNCFPHCNLHAVTCLDGAIPAHGVWVMAAIRRIKRHACGDGRGKYSELLAEVRMAGAGDPRSAAEYERMLGCLAGEQYVFVDVANLVGQEAQADVYVMRQKTGRCSTLSGIACTVG